VLDAIADRVALRLGAEHQQQHQHDWLTTVEAAEYLRCGKQRLYNLIQQEAIPVHREGKRLLFDRYELAEWVRTR
jgi:excisionase family DNA binding protein